MKTHTIIPVFGEQIEILVSSEDSNYSLCTAVQTSPPGGPPPRHLREEETFMVLEGEYEFFDGRSWTPMKPNEIRCSIRGHYHAFRNIGKTTAGFFLQQTEAAWMNTLPKSRRSSYHGT
jgi:mannose-6-phosphate isomerase-like protein (cupin superfamily)